MASRRALPLVVLLALVAALATGCYTVMRHPEADAWSSTSPRSDRGYGDYYGNDLDYLYRWTDPYYTSLYGGFPPAWGYYYYHPWTPTGPWWCDPWYPWQPWDPGGNTPPPAPVASGRHAWDRGPGAPSPYVPGVSGTPAPNVGSVPATPATPATPPSTPPPDTTRRTERRPDPARNEDNPRRNAWGR